MKPNSRFAHFFLADKFISQRDLKGTVGCVFFLGQHIGEENPYARAYSKNMAPFG